MKETGTAVKGFIVNDKEEVLIIKRRLDDVHRPGTWDLPGGRLNKDEDHLEGLKREIKEETNLDVEIKEKLNTHHFTRDDGQRIDMTVYVCKNPKGKVKLSEEHIEFLWLNIDDFTEKYDTRFEDDAETYRKRLKKK
jgi:8-oxo-dGTP diphosphatase